MTLGQLLQQWMDTRSVKAADVARGTGLTPAYLSRVLSDERKPSVKTLVKIADALLLDDKARGRLLTLAAGR